jgi:WD40 repeat protein
MKKIALSLIAVVLAATANAADPARPWSRSVDVGTNNCIRSLVFSPNNERLVVGCDKGVVKVFDDGCPDRLPTHVLEAKVYETQVKISGDGKRLLVSGCPGAISLLDLQNGKYLNTFPMQPSSCGLSTDGTRMWADDSIYDLTGTNEPKRVRQFEGSEVLQVSDKQIITAKDGKISFWNGADGKLQRAFETGSAKFTFHAISGSSHLVIADAKGVHIWDFAAGQRLATVPVKEACHDAVISPDGKRLVTNTSTGTAPPPKQNYTVRVWDVATGKELQTVCTAEFYWPIAMSPKGQLAYTKDGAHIEFLEIGTAP